MKIVMSLLAFVFGSGSASVIYANSENFVIMDVRTPEEFNGSHVKGALNFNILEDNFKEKVSKLDKTKTYKVYCRSGSRSGRAVQMMKSMGFTDVENIGGLGQAAKKLHRTCEGNPACE